MTKFQNSDPISILEPPVLQRLATLHYLKCLRSAQAFIEENRFQDIGIDHFLPDTGRDVFDSLVRQKTVEMVHAFPDDLCRLF